VATWDIDSPSGKSYVIDAPEGVSESAVLRFAQANDASWADGGRYSMPVQNARTEKAAIAAMQFSPEESRQITASEQSPENIAEWRQAIEKASDPATKAILQKGLDDTMAREPVANGGMVTWDVNAPDGQSYVVKAPVGVSESEVMAWAQKMAPSWRDGGVYEYKAASEPQRAPSEKDMIDAHVKGLTAEIERMKAQRGKLAAGEMETASTPGGAAVGRVRGPRDPRVAALDERIAALTAERDSLVPGETGRNVGGIGGALVGGGLGALVGGPIGGVLGAIAGAAGGTAAGTNLYDIPELRQVREVTDEEAAQLVKNRVIESLIWDGAFVLILGPGGRVIGKMLNGSKLKPALIAAAKESIGWDAVQGAAKKQLDDVIAKRAKDAPKKTGEQVSRAIGQPARPGAARDLVSDIATGTGRVPTQGEMRGVATGMEGFARKQSPRTFMLHDRKLSEFAQTIRESALSELDKAGAYDPLNLGKSVGLVVDSADNALKRATSPVFERAAQQNISVDMSRTKKVVDALLARDSASAEALLPPPVRERLEQFSKTFEAAPGMSPGAVQDFISGNKDILRELNVAGQPSKFVSAAFNRIVSESDDAFMAALKQTKDKNLVSDLLAARKLYKDTREDLFSDTMAAILRKGDRTAEDVGKMLVARGNITEIRNLRAALDRAVSLAPTKTRMRGTEVVELGKDAAKAERKRIDAGMVKGFIEEHTRSLTNLESKLTDPRFLDTLKELLTGPGAADPALNKKVLAEMDRTLGVMKLIRPETAPQPGRLPIPGMGSVGASTTVAAGTGAPIQVAAGGALGLIFGGRVLGKAVAKAMTTGNTGSLRAIQRAASLARVAGRATAAAEALRAAVADLQAELGDEEE